MYTPLLDDDSLPFRISTRHLPPPEEVELLVHQAYARYKDLNEGKVADYIPALAKVSPELFAIGDAPHEFSIQSVSKTFTSAMAIEVTR